MKSGSYAGPTGCASPCATAFALTAILTLSLGYAATTTIFSVVDSELWRALPYPEPDRLVMLNSRETVEKADTDAISMEELNGWRASAPAFAQLAAEVSSARRTTRTDHAESLYTKSVTANYFTTLGRSAMLGRVFDGRDAIGSDAVVLGERGWRKLFDADPQVIGRTLMLDNEPKVIVGVVAIDDSTGPDSEMFVPIDERSTIGNPQSVARSVIGRLSAAGTAEIGRGQIQAEIDRRGQQDPSRRNRTAVATDISAYYRTTSTERPLYFFLGASILVLALTIANVAGLLLARAFRRVPEFALRSALGGGTRAIAAQLGVEAGLIAIPGAALGLALAYQAAGLVGQVVPGDFLIRGMHIVVDLRVAAFTFAIAGIAMAGFILIPLGIARRSAPASALGSGIRGSALPSAGRTLTILLTAQVAVTLILLAGAGMFLRSFVALTHVPLGFDPESMWSMNVAPSGPRYASTDQVLAYAAELTSRARAIPGVRSAVVATSSPLNSGWLARATEAGAEAAAPNSGARSILRLVDAGYFQTLKTPMLRGREFLSTDVASAPPVAVVNEAFARAVFGDRNLIGQRVDLKVVRAPVKDGTVMIVGVSANVKNIFLNESTMPDVYLPFAQQPSPSIELLVRGGAGEHMPKALRAAAAGADPFVPVTRVATLDLRVERALGRDRFFLILVAGFAVVAVLIGTIGIYGAMAFAATARCREFGVRLALGASPRGLLMASLWRAARVGLIGGTIGVVGAMAISFLIGDALYLVPGSHNGLLFNVTTTDPIALTSAMAGVVLVALLAGVLPARRVAKVDPASALRAD